ncbi:MAG TPA: signal peptidase I [Eubacterium sp.]|nr:signal peptidase I [Eubacterium sp.]
MDIRMNIKMNSNMYGNVDSNVDGENNRWLRKFLLALADVIFILLAGIVLVTYLPGVIGFKSYRVLSASMEPKYHVGSLVYVKQVDMDSINTGDVITFHISESNLVTHRVVEKDSIRKGFITKGDANEVNDGGLVTYDSVVGKVMFDIPLLGYVSSFMSSLYGKCLVIGVLIVMMALEILYNRMEKMNCKNVLQYRKGNMV